VKMAEEQTPPAFIVNPHAPDIFADAAPSFSLNGGVVRITLATLRPLQVGGASGPVVIGQLVMPLEGAQGLAVGLYDFLKAQGVAPSSGQTAQ
jgi:hypothetical protein